MMKEKNPKRSHRVNLNLTPEEYAKIEKEWKASLCKHLGVYVRNIVFSRPIVMTVRNRSVDALMEEAIRLRKELNVLRDCFDRPMMDSHSFACKDEVNDKRIAYTLDKEILFNKIDEIKVLLQKMTESWLR